jgi:hypothetical protein
MEAYMATSQVSLPSTEQRTANHVGVLRLAASAGIASGFMFVLCWLATFVTLSSPTHALIRLFTAAEIQSSRALIEGGVWSLLFGVLLGGLIAAFYNLLGSLNRR